MPTCTKCDAPAVTHIRYSGQRLCREHFLRFFDERAKAEVAAQGRLPKGTVAVALSGGKDSVSLLHFLHGLTRERRDVDLVAVSVDEGIAGYRDGALRICEQVTKDLGVPWHVVCTEDLAGYTIDAFAAGTAGPDGDAAQRLKVAAPAEDREQADPRPSCGPCGVFRRLGINTVARDLGAVAVATGHNLDDQAQTVLMNVLGGDADRLARLAPHTDPQPGLVPRILPFRRIPEKEVLLYALLHGLPVHDEEECPYAARAQRFALRDVLLDLEKATPGTRHRLVAFQEKVKPALVADRSGEAAEAATCRDCGEPTSGDTCRACLWKA